MIPLVPIEPPTAIDPLQPHDAAAAAAMLADAAARGETLLPCGSGTKLEPSIAVSTRSISTRGLSLGLAHYAGDLVATAPAGCTLREVNAVLASERQWIPLDPPHAADATIGGIVATNDSGPRRHGFGAPRDLIIGVEVALTSGTVARAGGRVVKNVAGYDLGRLFCGSRGSLGLITAVTFKLAPRAPASKTVVARFARAQDAIAAAVELARSPALTPTAVELVAPDPRLLVRFESTEQATHLMAQSATDLLSAATDVMTLDEGAEQAEWAAHHQLESSRGEVMMAVSALPTASAPMFEDIDRAAASTGALWGATGRAALGVFRLRLSGDAETLRRAAPSVREAAVSRGGHAQVLLGRDLLSGALDPFGPPGSSAALALAVKRRFDPAAVLPYPWNGR
jgi:glycolate oxidase FAD binding subunit